MRADVRRTVVASVLLLGLLAPLLPVDAATPTYGSLAGTVFSSAIPISPLKGAKVVVGSSGFTGTTATNGSYRIDNIPVGSYEVFIEATGFENTSKFIGISKDKTTEEDFYVKRLPGTIKGKVTDKATGKPVIIALVGVEGFFPDLTGSDGNYELEVDPETYTVRADAPFYRPATAKVSVAAGQTVTKDFQLVRYWLLLVRVLKLDTSAPIESATVTVSGRIQTTPANGTVEFILDAAGGYVITIRANGFVRYSKQISLKQDDTISELTISLPKADQAGGPINLGLIFGSIVAVVIVGVVLAVYLNERKKGGPKMAPAPVYQSQPAAPSPVQPGYPPQPGRGPPMQYGPPPPAGPGQWPQQPPQQPPGQYPPR